MENSKLLLSEEEYVLVQNSMIILTKNRIIKKVVEMFAGLAEAYQVQLGKNKNVLPVKIFSISPKISKGENYNGLPYVMLDYPRIFSQKEIFAIRTFFWWGNYFSITLHLKGEFKVQFSENLHRHKSILKNGFLISTGANEWSHDLEDTNYRNPEQWENELVSSADPATYLKIAVMFTFDQWENIPDLMKLNYDIILKMLSS